LYEIKNASHPILKADKDKTDMYVESDKLISGFGQLRIYAHNLSGNNEWLRKGINATTLKIVKAGIIIGRQLPTEPKQHEALGLIEDERNLKVYSWDQILSDIQAYCKY